MNRFLLGLAMTAIAIPGSYAQDEFDDIYYNPKSEKESSRKSDIKSSYIEDFSDMDVDEYNRRGFYYETAVDTIGQTAENAEDFVYTQQIQKYYNPTIVVDNSDVLSDILENSYGNVEIVIDNGSPSFTSIYTGTYGWSPSYYNWCLRPAWTWSYAWGPVHWSWIWGPSWAWDPVWSWGYPSWSYYPSWGWGYGPGWGPRPPRPLYGYHRPVRPGATRPGAPNPGWSYNTRPGGNYSGGGSCGRPGSRPMGRPAAGMSGTTSSGRYSDRRQQTSVSTGMLNLGGTRPNVGTTVRSDRKTAKTATLNGSMVNSNITVRNDGNVIDKSGNTSKRSGLVRTERNSNTTRKNNTVTSQGSLRSSGSNGSTVRRETTGYRKMTTTKSAGNRSYNSTRNRSYNSSGSRNYNVGSSRRTGSVSRGGAGGGASRSGGGGHRGGRR